VTSQARRSARAALDAARPAVARLDGARGPEDLAADLIETWSAVETALRSLVGSSALTGQALIREARQRQLINFDQGNSIAEFNAVRDRLETASYRPTDSDVNAAKSAFTKLETSVMADEAPVAYVASPSVSAPTLPTPDQTLTMDAAPTSGRGMPAWAMLVVMLVVLGGIGTGIYFAFAGRGGGDALQRGITYYNNRQREAAVGEFNKAVRDNPKDPLPHIYLARMAREVGNFSMATQELQLALQAEPNNALALREMGANLLTQGNYDLARRFYVRAVQADPNDKSAQGYLGCTLMRLGRAQEAATFLNRAGAGPWTACTPGNPMQPGMPPGTIPPTGVAPAGTPGIPRP